MRKIVLDTETTGLEYAQGHRIIEIGCVELQDRRLTGTHYHQYLQPDRMIDEGAIEVHGITNEFLQDKLRFADIVDEFIEFISGAELIIHNAPFDVGFIDNELSLYNPTHKKLKDLCTITDTLQLARQKHPGVKNSLDALCKRYDVDNTQRQLHGALLDAEILADVYLRMTGGQTKLFFNDNAQEGASDNVTKIEKIDSNRPRLKIIGANELELIEHQKMLKLLDKSSAGQCQWPKENTIDMEK